MTTNIAELVKGMSAEDLKAFRKLLRGEIDENEDSTPQLLQKKTKRHSPKINTLFKPIPKEEGKKMDLNFYSKKEQQKIKKETPKPEDDTPKPEDDTPEPEEDNTPKPENETPKPEEETLKPEEDNAPKPEDDNAPKPEEPEEQEEPELENIISNLKFDDENPIPNQELPPETLRKKQVLEFEIKKKEEEFKRLKKELEELDKKSIFIKERTPYCIAPKKKFLFVFSCAKQNPSRFINYFKGAARNIKDEKGNNLNVKLLSAAPFGDAILFTFDKEIKFPWVFFKVAGKFGKEKDFPEFTITQYNPETFWKDIERERGFSC